MHLPTHALASWLIGEAAGLRTRRDRTLTLCAGLVMDLDAASLLFGPEAYERWHRTLLHNAPTALLVTLLAFAFAGAKDGRGRAALAALLAFHGHLLCDLVGSAGPEGSIWPVPYFQPFSAVELQVAWQWPLASLQNVALTVALLVAQVFVARRRGRTIVEALSPRADAAVMEVIRRRFGAPVTGR